MKNSMPSGRTAFAPCALIAGALSFAPAPSLAQFVEPEVEVLRVFSGEQNGDYFGWVSARIDDLDGDGVGELIVPAIGYQGFAGRVTVFSGADGSVLNDILGAPGQVLGFGVGAAGDVDADGYPDYIIGGARVAVFSGKTHEVLWELAGTTGFGHGVGTAQDVDQDGHDDLIVGSETTNTSTTATGRVYVISGATGEVIWTRDGETAGALFGSGVGSLGDVNRDRIPDVVVGAWGAGPTGGGEAYILSGKDGRVIHKLEPQVPSEARTFGRFFASGAGDVDKDGIGDAFVGDFGAAAGGVAGTGQAYVFSGRTGRAIHVLTGFSPEGLGPGRGIPDVNGDGHADILVAGWTNSEGAPQAGKVYLFSGRSGALLRTITANVPSDNFGVDAISAGDTNGDGYDDFLGTSVGLSFMGTDVGRAFLIAGSKLPCPADLDGDKRVGRKDLRKMLRAIRKGGDADLNGDSVTDYRDLKVLLKDWGRCPKKKRKASKK